MVTFGDIHITCHYYVTTSLVVSSIGMDWYKQLEHGGNFNEIEIFNLQFFPFITKRLENFNSYHDVNPFPFMQPTSRIMHRHVTPSLHQHKFHNMVAKAERSNPWRCFLKKCLELEVFATDPKDLARYRKYLLLLEVDLPHLFFFAFLLFFDHPATCTAFSSQQPTRPSLETRDKFWPWNNCRFFLLFNHF